MEFFDGERRWFLRFKVDALQRIRSNPLIDLHEDRVAFAFVFHHFYLRLVVFFGCLGIFMNLFRGEMLDKTLHYWLLAPARREVWLSWTVPRRIDRGRGDFHGGCLDLLRDDGSRGCVILSADAHPSGTLRFEQHTLNPTSQESCELDGG